MPGLSFIGAPELLVLGVLLLVVFGPRRLPELGRSLGGGMREFKDSITGMHRDEQPALAVGPLAADPLAAERKAVDVER